MIQSTEAELQHESAVPAPFLSFRESLQAPLTKAPIRVLQLNLGKRCNLACTHCHVEAGPNRTEELSEAVCEQLIALIHQFPQIEVVDLTGGAPEMLYGFKLLVEAARSAGKQVMVRSNLTIYFEDGFEDIPAYCAEHQVQIVASLPCYLPENVDKMRGQGVYDTSIQALQWLNRLGYGQDPHLILDLVYNPPIPKGDSSEASVRFFSLTPDQNQLEQDYKAFLSNQFGISFSHLFTITNLPVGRTGQYLQRQGLYQSYVQFLADHFNPLTVDALMCRNELSVDYRGYIYDCDFNQMAEIPAKTATGETLTVAKLLAAGCLDLIDKIQTAPYCYGCTAGCGSSCGGALT
jgi:radical SAM/Cys-rich protein